VNESDWLACVFPFHFFTSALMMAHGSGETLYLFQSTGIFSTARGEMNRAAGRAMVTGSLISIYGNKDSHKCRMSIASRRVGFDSSKLGNG